ncbi:MAG: hypothetical protein ABJC79_09005, partial [Acidimicrobiia bacterium]
MAVVSDVGTTARSRARVEITVYAVLVVGALAVSTVVSDTAAGKIRGAVALSAVISAVVAARRSPHVAINPWMCIAAAIGFWSSGYLVGDIVRSSGASPTHWTDALALSGYLSVGIGLTVIARLRTDLPSRTAFLDASVLAIAGAMLIWVVLVTPMAHPADGSLDRFVAAALPLGDGILLACLGWLVLAPGRRSPALSMLGGAIALLLVSDLGRALGLRLGHDWQAASELSTWCAYGLMGAAAIVATRHMRESRDAFVTPVEHNRRLILLGLA